MDFQDKTVLIVGGAAGIGAAIAYEVAARGATVAVADRSVEGLATTASGIAARGGVAHTATVDLSDSASVERMASWCTDVIGSPDLVLVTVVDYASTFASLDDMKVDDWKQSFEVNFFGYIRVLEHLLPPMRQRGSGIIALTASTVALLPDPSASILLRYKAIKHALLGLSQALAVALEGTGVQSISFCPSLTATPNAAASLEQSKFASLAGKMPGAATAEDVAKLFVAELDNEEFLICAHPGYRELLVDLAAERLDPIKYMAGLSVAAGSAAS